ncbi:MAG: hypothetical protein JWP01_3075 [Myxococcales bacterium]|nr:hypothetical protein [Myxococcales bacterium]
MTTLRFSLPVSLAAGCVAALALPTHVPAAVPAPQPVLTRDPATLDTLLARYDRMPPGPERDALALVIDKHAGQRYATVSRLYWYTDLDAAEAAAKASHKPILALKMLGRLDEDLSCANSRMFRTTLYANETVSKFLRSNFVLYWSSERPVPRVTIDFGDGRRIESTTTGNSAHYVLDETGVVLDVLPGLYAPPAFTAELTESLALAKQVAPLAPEQRAADIRRYHAAAGQQIARDWNAIAGAPYLPASRQLLTQAEVDTVLARAQRATMAKAFIEVPQLRAITAGTDPGQISESELALWASAGQKTWNIGDPIVASASIWKAAVAPPKPTRATKDVLDARSRALIAQLHNAGATKATESATATMIARLEQHIVADSAINQYKLRRQIHARLATETAPATFADLNTWIYAVVFHTPRTDAWLGLLPRTDFTGLPGDGALVP